METCPEYNKLTFDFYYYILNRKRPEAKTISAQITDHFQQCKECREDCPFFYMIRDLVPNLVSSVNLINYITKHFEECKKCQDTIAIHIKALKAPKTKTKKGP